MPSTNGRSTAGGVPPGRRFGEQQKITSDDPHPEAGRHDRAPGLAGETTARREGQPAGLIRGKSAGRPGMSERVAPPRRRDPRHGGRREREVARKAGQGGGKAERQKPGSDGRNAPGGRHPGEEKARPLVGAGPGKLRPDYSTCVDVPEPKYKPLKNSLKFWCGVARNVASKLIRTSLPLPMEASVASSAPSRYSWPTAQPL